MKSNFKTGLLFTTMGQYSSVLIQLIINVVLSRIISVKDFGIVATVQIFLVFFQNIASGGMGPAIIQNKKIEKKEYGVLFNYTVIFSIIFAIIFSLLGELVAFWYDNPIYKNLFFAMSIIIISEGMNVVPTALLNKELRFKTLNIRLLVCNLAGAIIGIIAAIAGMGVYTLIISASVPAVSSLILNFFIVEIDYTKSFNLDPLKKVARFSINQLGFNITNYFSKNTDNLLIGKFLGPSRLANYQKSYQLITLPNIIAVGILGSVLQPILAKHEDNVELIRKTFLSIVHILALLFFPISAFMVVNAKPIIFFLFGAKWYASVIPFAVLATTAWAQALSAVTASIFMSRNRSKLLLLSGIFSSSAMFLFTIMGILFDNIKIVAIFVCLFYLFNFIITYWILMEKVLESHFFIVIKEIASPFVLGGISIVILYCVNMFINVNNNFLTLLLNGVCLLIIIFVYCLVTGELKRLKQLY